MNDVRDSLEVEEEGGRVELGIEEVWAELGSAEELLLLLAVTVDELVGDEVVGRVDELLGRVVTWLVLVVGGLSRE